MRMNYPCTLCSVYVHYTHHYPLILELLRLKEMDDQAKALASQAQPNA
jgi:hypothetical protein|uniref:Uncharacterized protein n=2 Tax=Picea TaxID=3328 RepID=A0A101LU32_PICGL|nr:hypothetical protein ABT39_MTgene3433 [Picea glauca]QHR92715.1 hypothetical protein Q903MT_gene6763 [Picea sitchensis]